MINRARLAGFFIYFAFITKAYSGEILEVKTGDFVQNLQTGDAPLFQYQGIKMSGGWVSGLNTYGRSSVEVMGGNLGRYSTFFDDSVVNVTGAESLGILRFEGRSQATISNVLHTNADAFSLHGRSHVTLGPGAVIGAPILAAREDSTLLIEGGAITNISMLDRSLLRVKSGTASAVFNDTSHFILEGGNATVSLLDNSTAELVSGHIGNLEVLGTGSSFTITDSVTVSRFTLTGTNSISLKNQTVSYANLSDATSAHLDDCRLLELYATGSAALTIKGAVFDTIELRGASAADVTGSSGEFLILEDDARARVSGRTSYFLNRANGIIDWFGGQTENLILRGNSLTRVYGRNLSFDQATGRLSGVLADGTVLSDTIDVRIFENATIELITVPEPSTIQIFASTVLFAIPMRFLARGFACKTSRKNPGGTSAAPTDRDVTTAL